MGYWMIVDVLMINFKIKTYDGWIFSCQRYQKGCQILSLIFLIFFCNCTIGEHRVMEVFYWPPICQSKSPSPLSTYHSPGLDPFHLFSQLSPPTTISVRKSPNPKSCLALSSKDAAWPDELLNNCVFIRHWLTSRQSCWLITVYILKVTPAFAQWSAAKYLI